MVWSKDKVGARSPTFYLLKFQKYFLEAKVSEKRKAGKHIQLSAVRFQRMVKKNWGDARKASPQFYKLIPPFLPKTRL